MITSREKDNKMKVIITLFEKKNNTVYIFYYHF